MARELRKAARESSEDVAAHRGLIKMIPQWERGARAPASGTGCCTARSSTMRSAACRTAWQSVPISRCGSLRSAPAQPACPVPARSRRWRPLPWPSRGNHDASGDPRLATKAIDHLNEVADELAELSATTSPAGLAMSARDNEIRRLVAELDVHVTEVGARLAALKALLADDTPSVTDAR